MIINKKGKKERIVCVFSTKDYSNFFTPEDNERFKNKLKDVNKLLLLKQKDIVRELIYSLSNKNDLFSDTYKSDFSIDDIVDLEVKLMESANNMKPINDSSKKIQDDDLMNSNNKKKIYIKDENKTQDKKEKLFEKIQEITNQFEWYYNIVNKKLHFSLKNGKEIETDLLTPKGKEEITKIMLYSMPGNYIRFINETFQDLDKNISKSPTCKQLNTEFKNLLDIILDNDSNSKYNFEFKKVNSLDRIVLDIEDRYYNKFNKNLILEIKEEEKSLSRYSIFIGSLDEQNIERKDGILLNSYPSSSYFIHNGKKEEFPISMIVDLLHKDKKNFNYSDTIFVLNLKRATNSSELSR